MLSQPISYMKSLKTALLGLVAAGALTTTSHATVTFLGTIVDGTPSSAANETLWVTHLLNMPNLTTEIFVGETLWRNANPNFGFTGVGAPTKVETGSTTVAGLYTGIVLAKYGGGNSPNQGTAVFYVNGFGQNLPGIWGSIDGNGPIVGQQALSHFSTFSTAVRVPDGGTSLALMGIGLVSLASFRRRK